jgi:hypothetical protein
MSETIAETKKPEATAAPAPETTPAVDPTTPPDPIKVELDKIKKPKTEAEKAAFTLKKNAERAAELGLDPMTILGLSKKEVVDDEDVDEDAPVTVGMLNKRDQDKAIKTTVSLADDIADEAERELVKHHLSHTIKPSGNAEQDLRNARTLVNSVKNGMVVDEIVRKGTAKTTSSGGSVPPKPVETFEPTSEERAFMGKPYNLSKDDILAARKKAAKTE